VIVGDVTPVGDVSVVPIAATILPIGRSPGAGDPGSSTDGTGDAGSAAPADLTNSLDAAPAPATHHTAAHPRSLGEIPDPLAGGDGPVAKHAVTSETPRPDDPAADPSPAEAPAQPVGGRAAEPGSAAATPADGAAGAFHAPAPGHDGFWAVAEVGADGGTARDGATGPADSGSPELAPQAAGSGWGLGRIDPSALEQGLAQFLGQLQAAGARVAGSPALLGLTSWLAAATATAVALEVGRREVCRARARAAGAAVDDEAWSWFSTFSPPAGWGG
jgi:hypothetical protein